MKKYKFSMQKVLDYKEDMQSHEKNILMGMKVKYNTLCDQLDTLKQSYEDCKAEYEAKCEEGMTITQVIVQKSYILQLQEKIDLQKELMAKAAAEMEKQVEKINAITIEKSSIERLKDRNYEEYKALESKENEIFINEFVINSASQKEESF
ncbi:MAG: flagellar export protein FliJ [Clostridiales bacterium 43-6]|nr:MAG: flagellar export protein FliJ [Clostridiales bacterium 43-6]